MKVKKTLDARRATVVQPQILQGEIAGEERMNQETFSQKQKGSIHTDTSSTAETLKSAIGWSLDTEAILPEQFFRLSQESHAVWTGERRLLLAVLTEAVDSFLRYRAATTRRGRRLFNETIEWFWLRDQSWLYSFETICHHLDLDADSIREGLRRLCETRTDKEPSVVLPRSGKSLRHANRFFANAA